MFIVKLQKSTVKTYKVLKEAMMSDWKPLKLN